MFKLCKKVSLKIPIGSGDEDKYYDEDIFLNIKFRQRSKHWLWDVCRDLRYYDIDIRLDILYLLGWEEDLKYEVDENDNYKNSISIPHYLLSFEDI